jgi:hypothetical protein
VHRPLIEILCIQLSSELRLGPLFVVLLLITFAGAQNAPAARPSISATQVFERYLAATGGLNHHLDVQTIRVTGTLGFSGKSYPMGDFEFSQCLPESDLFKLQTISHGTVWAGLSDGVPFKRRSIGGVGLFEGVSVLTMEESLRTLNEWDWGARFSKLELLGISKINGKSTYAIGLTSRGGDRQVRYYDTETFLLVGLDLAQRIGLSNDKEALYKVEVYFSQYKESQGLKFPRIIEYQASGNRVQLGLEQILTNIPIDEATFHPKH